MTCDEGIEIKKQLDIKTNECQLLNEKLRDNEIIINENLKKIENHDQELQDKEKMVNEATETLKSLELDFKTTQDKLKSTTLLLNTSRTNQQMQNDRYEHLDKEFNRIDLELNDSKAECKQLQIKIADYETNSTKLTEDLSAAESNLIAVKEELLQK